MNERAIKLYKQATEFAYSTIGKDHSDTAYFQGTVAGKFAELIVRECCSAIRLDDAFNGGKFQRTILEHFGV
jgi:hypothetical protein